MENNYNTVGGIVYNNPQLSQNVTPGKIQLPQYSMIHEPVSLGLGTASFGYTPQYSLQTTSSGYVPQTYSYSYPEMVPLTFGGLGSAPTNTFSVVTVPSTAFGNYGVMSNVISNPAAMSTQTTFNRNAWNKAWSLYGSQLGLADQIAYKYLLGQIEHESGGFQYMEEIASGEAYEGRKDLGNTSSGDGVRYKGRGPIQVTGKSNYKKIYDEFFVPNGLGHLNIVENPELGSDPEVGSLMSIGWLAVTDNGKRAIEKSNRRDIVGLTRAINGGTNGLDDRIKRTNTLLKEPDHENNIT